MQEFIYDYSLLRLISGNSLNEPPASHTIFFFKTLLYSVGGRKQKAGGRGGKCTYMGKHFSIAFADKPSPGLYANITCTAPYVPNTRTASRNSNVSTLAASLKISFNPLDTVLSL